MSLENLPENWYEWISSGQKVGVIYDMQVGDDDIARHHDPHWYQNEQTDTESFRDGAEPEQNGRLRNRTDYNLPRSWGRMTTEQKIEWYRINRVWRQVNRQYDNGMWDQWDFETLHMGLSPLETLSKLQDDGPQFGDSN